MIKALLIALYASASFTAYAGSKDKPVDLTGNWKEIQRMTKDKAVIAYTDTIRIDFLVGNEFVWQKAGSFLFKGTYKVTPTSLDLGSRYFTIVSSSAKRILLQDEQGFYELSKYNKQEATTDNSAANNSARSNRETSGDIDIASFEGNWETYKRTSKVQQQNIDYSFIPKRVNLQVNKKRVTGALHAAQETNGHAGWKLVNYENGYLNFSGTSDRKLKVLKCAGNELILEEDNYVYFLKKFG
jgi:hypothetical protein